MNRLKFPRTGWILISPFIALASAADEIDFSRDIRPILTKHCTSCHGGVKEAGNVSFIYREKALGEAESGKFPIVPGNPGESEMVRRIRSADPDEIMPKPKHGPRLAEPEIVLIENWIAQGAKWKNHWAFVPPVENALPQVSNGQWPAVPLDGFVLSRLENEKLTPAPEAAPGEWLRRASFDLTGLPPTASELDLFTSSADPRAARDAAVDRLLASPAYGERWAAVWLDLARYSDTFGFEKDPQRDIWPYRDWIIRAFNEDKPYDQFTVEQLAGDLLPNASAEQRLATAFHRNTQTNTEGGTDDEEFRVAAVIDRTNTTWTTWQATTFGCVQCHSHPYDPIEHEEFYKFTAFFNQTADCDQDDDHPRMKIMGNPDETAVASDLETRLRTLRETLNNAGRILTEDPTTWEAFIPTSVEPSHGSLTVHEGGLISSEGTLPKGNIHRVSGPARSFRSLRLDILPDSNDPKKWPERGSFVTAFEVNVRSPDGSVSPVVMKEVFVDRFSEPHEPHPAGNVGGFPKLEGPRWFVFVPEKPVIAAPGSLLEISMTQNAETAGNQALPVRRFSIGLSDRPAWETLVNDPQRVAMGQERKQMAEQYDSMTGTLVPVMVGRPARETRIFARGNRLSKEQPVSAGVPKLLGGTVSDNAMDRLDMARWIANPENPLTSRVMVNRLWGELFGTGIVETSEDFGISGTPPSHPELLDHLALRFSNYHRWSVKSMLREIVLSSTYRQTHRAPKSLVERDPANRLLARGPRQRLSAEMVRDQALSVSGMLSPKMYGTPVFPPQPDGVWSSIYNNAKWSESTGEDRYRRAIYTFHKRTSAFPGFLTFDAPSRDLCGPRRIASNTPLQALVTLNDPAHMEFAQGLARRMETHSGSLENQLAFGYELCTQQPPSTGIVAELVALHTEAAADYRNNPGEAAKLGTTPEAAAMVLTANTILNLDSALNR